MYIMDLLVLGHRFELEAYQVRRGFQQVSLKVEHATCSKSRDGRPIVAPERANTVRYEPLHPSYCSSN